MHIDNTRCDVCGTCVAVCPADAIVITEWKAIIDPVTCISCGRCWEVCPVAAVEKD